MINKIAICKVPQNTQKTDSFFPEHLFLLYFVASLLCTDHYHNWLILNQLPFIVISAYTGRFT